MWKKHSLVLSSAVAAALLLSACGGGNDGPRTQPPPAAQGDTLAIIGNNLVTFNRATPGTIATSMPITGITAGETIVGGDIRPANSTYYVVTSGSAVYTVSRATGLASNRTPLSNANGPVTLDPAATTFGVDFNPVPDRLRVTTNTGQNLRINVDAATANTTVDPNLTVVTLPAPNNGAKIDAVAYSNSFAAACRTGLFYIDTTADQLLTAFDPNTGVLRVVGNLGVDASGASGFEITTDATGANVARASLNVGGTVGLYTINLTTGAATLVGSLGTPSSSTPVIGLGTLPPATAPTQAAGDVLAVTAANSFISFNPAAPSKLCTTGPAITGLNTGENVVDIDLRSSNSTLYALTDANRILTIDRTSGVATNLPLTGAAIPALATGHYSLDVNPQANALRLVGGTNNFAISFAGVVSDATATPAQLSLTIGSGVTAPTNTVNVGGVAYVNAIAGTNLPAFTALYDIDVANDTLFLQNSPASGQLFAPVPLGLPAGTDLLSVGGFDINGLSNVGLAAFNVSTTTTASILYSINVTGSAGATGPAATLAAGTVAASTIGGGPGSIGPATVVRGLAFQNNAQQALTASVVGLTAIAPQQVVSFALPAASATLPVASITTSAPLALTGLTDGETTVLGIDRRPRDGLIYALGNAGNIYTLNATTGALTKVSTLNMGLPLAVGPVAIDFNPQVDRLRVIDSTGKNLRVNVDNGVTAVDTPLSVGQNVTATNPLQVVAAAYSNNFFGVLPVPAAPAVAVPPQVSTTLYDIDVGNSLLFAQNPANGGVLNNIPGTTPPAPGPLGGTFGAAADFDIIGGSNSFALAVLQPGSSASTSALYRVNLLNSLPSNANPAGGAIVAGTATQLATTIIDPTNNPLTLGTATILLAPSPTM